MKRICVVNINWLGDAIFSTPVFRALRRQYPQAHIACLCVPRVAEVLALCGDINEIIVYDENGKDIYPWAKLALIFKLRSKKFDTAFLLHRSLTRALIIFLSGIPVRIGFGKNKFLLTQHIAMNAEGLHRRDYYLSVLSAMKVKIEGIQTFLDLPHKTYTLPEQRYIVFNIGGNWDLKKWPLKNWSALVQKIKANTNIDIVFTGSNKDVKTVEEVISDAPGQVINLAGQSSLEESLQIYAGAVVVVSGDSGPLHLANSVGASVIGIFGPTRPEITGPCGIGRAEILFKEIGCNKAPCYHLGCKNNLCMQAIGVNDVWQAIQKYIG